jgi:hypothetical protein
MTTKDDILRELLNCGTRDLDFLESLINDFDVEVSDVVDRAQEFSEERIECNDLIYAVYEQAIIDAAVEVSNELDIDIDPVGDEVYNIYTNYCDSHLYFNTKEGDVEENATELYNKDDILKAIRERYTSTS